MRQLADAARLLELAINLQHGGGAFLSLGNLVSVVRVALVCSCFSSFDLSYRRRGPPPLRTTRPRSRSRSRSRTYCSSLSLSSSRGHHGLTRDKAGAWRR
jgi:hypothetical protein